MTVASNSPSGVPPLFTDLSKLLSGDMDCSYQGLESHSGDGSPYRIEPQAVLYPKNTSDIKHAIAFSREYRLPITVRGGGTAGTGGCLGEGIILDMSRYFTRIRQMNMMEHTVTVDTGVTLGELEEKLSLWNMEIPALCGGDNSATVGGLVATKSASASSFHAGTIREWIEGLTIIVDTGEEHHIRDGITPSGRLLGIYQSVFPLLSEHISVLRSERREESDDATGYFLWSASIGPRQLLDQLVGSEGTLGIITSVTFRLVPRKRRMSTFLIPVAEKDLNKMAMVSQSHRVEALYMFDENYKKLLVHARPNILPAEIDNSNFYLLTTFRDNEERTLTSRTATFLRTVPQVGAIEISESAALWLTNHKNKHEIFLSSRESTKILATFAEGIIVSKHLYYECLSALKKELGYMTIQYVLSGYIGSGHISLVTLFDTSSPSYEDDLLSYNKKISSIVERFNGGLSAVAGDGLEKSAYMGFVYSEATIKLFTLLKNAWDPLGIFNPSKKTGISTDYLRKHLRGARLSA